MEIFGVNWVGLNAENGRKLVLSVTLLAVVTLASALVRVVSTLVLRGRGQGVSQVRFWTHQVVLLVGTLIGILGLLSIWFSDPTRLATAFGLVSAGLAFALQRVITSIAGYFVILRSNNFTVGDRIAMGGRAGGCHGSGLYPDDDHGDGPTTEHQG